MVGVDVGVAWDGSLEETHSNCAWYMPTASADKGLDCAIQALYLGADFKVLRSRH